jgi:hypothetical protein
VEVPAGIAARQIAIDAGLGQEGRQLTILLFGAATASWATRAAIAAAGTGTAAGAGMAGGSGSSSAGSLIGSVGCGRRTSGLTSGAARTLILEGAFMTSKKIGISLGIAACVFFGGLALFFTVSGPPGRPATREPRSTCADRLRIHQATR